MRLRAALVAAFGAAEGPWRLATPRVARRDEWSAIPEDGSARSRRRAAGAPCAARVAPPRHWRRSASRSQRPHRRGHPAPDRCARASTAAPGPVLAPRSRWRMVTNPRSRSSASLHHLRLPVGAAGAAILSARAANCCCRTARLATPSRAASAKGSAAAIRSGSRAAACLKAAYSVGERPRLLDCLSQLEQRQQHRRAAAIGELAWA